MRRKKNGKVLKNIIFLFLLLLALTACGQTEEKELSEKGSRAWEELCFDRSVDPEYAEGFSIHYTKDGYTWIDIGSEGGFLVVPEGAEIPLGVPKDISVIQRPVEQIYLAATSAMDAFCELDGLDTIGFSGTKAEEWYIEEARAAMEAGRIPYAGKYNAPDYEQMVQQGCTLAIESTMIYHTPEVKEKLETLGIPVLVDRSSYEPHPLGRTEWVRVYGALLGKDALAEQLMAEQAAQLQAVAAEEKAAGKTVGFFYISSKGYVNVRKSGDYVSKIIELGGGTYLFPDLGEKETALSTVNLQMEEFYAAARTADILIYNSTIDGELSSLEELLKKYPLLADCKAVQKGDIWCTTQNMFQETMHLGDMIRECSVVIQGGNTDELQYFYRLT